MRDGVNAAREMRRTIAAGFRKRPLAWSASVILAGITASFGLWDPLEVYERDYVCRTTVQSLDSLRADVRSDMQSRILAQVRLAELLSEQPLSPGWDCELSARLFLEHHAGYLRLEWTDSTSHVLWAVAGDSPTTAGVMGLARRAVSAVRLPLPVWTETRPSLTRFQLPDGRSGLRLAVPVTRGNGIENFLVAIVDLHAALDAMVEDHRDLGYSVSVLEGGTEIYRMAGSDAENESSLAEEATLDLAGATWTIRVWPRHETLVSAQSYLPRLAMMLGGLLGSVLMLAIHFGRSAQASSRELQRAHDELEERVRARTTELRQLNSTLRAEVFDRTRAEDSYRDLSGRLLKLQDEERRRIARELHDSTAQMLGALAINMDRSLVLADSQDWSGLTGILGESGRFVEEVTQEIRTVSYLLHPPMLDDLGLEYVLPWYTAGFSQRSGIVTELDISPGLGRLPCDVELALFRIVQEALANVHRHSGSATVSISLARAEQSVTLEVRDRGSGLPKAVRDSAPGAGGGAGVGVGIAGMRERVRQLKGCMEIASGADGTRLRTVLPVADRSGPGAPDRRRCSEFSERDDGETKGAQAE